MAVQAEQAVSVKPMHRPKHPATRTADVEVEPPEPALHDSGSSRVARGFLTNIFQMDGDTWKRGMEKVLLEVLCH